MGIDLSVVLDHRLQASDVALLPGRANDSTKMRQAAEQLWALLSRRWRNLGPVDEFANFTPDERLSIQEIEAAWSRTDPPSFKWAGFFVYVGRQALHASHIEKLAGFVLDLDELREPLRACALALAEELGATKVVFGPDSSSPFELAAEGAREGRSLQEILAELDKRCGPSARDIRGMADYYDGDDGDAPLALERSCYFVEFIGTPSRPLR